jgi:anaerobic ribonucleoside-triphosphate reductase
VKALIGDEKLTEEFKAKAATIFEAAIKSKLKVEKQKIEDGYKLKNLKKNIDATKAELVEKVDSYLNYVVEEWMKSKRTCC